MKERVSDNCLDFFPVFSSLRELIAILIGNVLEEITMEGQVQPDVLV